MNYTQSTIPTITPLTSTQLNSIITGQTFQPPTSISYTPTPGNSNVGLLTTSPDLSLPQQTIRFTTPNSNTINVPVVQFGINISSINPNQDTNILPPGIMGMSIYAKADKRSDEDNIGLRFYLLGKNNGTYTNLIANGSDLVYLYNSTILQIYSLNLYIQNPIDLTPYTSLQIIIASKNRNANAHTSEIYFQSSFTYSHIHTTFGIYGPTGNTGATGPMGTFDSILNSNLIANNYSIVNTNSNNIGEISLTSGVQLKSQNGSNIQFVTDPAYSSSYIWTLRGSDGVSTFPSYISVNKIQAFSTDSGSSPNFLFGAYDSDNAPDGALWSIASGRYGSCSGVLTTAPSSAGCGHIIDASNQIETNYNLNDYSIYQYQGEILIQDCTNGYMYKFLMGGNYVWLLGTTVPNFVLIGPPQTIINVDDRISFGYVASPTRGYKFTNLTTTRNYVITGMKTGSLLP